jgi:hypothetical protein
MAAPTPVMCFAFHLIYLVLPLACVLGPVALLFAVQWQWQALGAGCIVLYSIWCLISSRSEQDGVGRGWEAFENFWLFSHLFEWFPMRLVRGAALPPTSADGTPLKYIFAVHPYAS